MDIFEKIVLFLGIAILITIWVFLICAIMAFITVL